MFETTNYLLSVGVGQAETGYFVLTSYDTKKSYFTSHLGFSSLMNLNFHFYLHLQEKESLESRNRLIERELSEIKDKLQVVSRGLNNAATNISSQEATIDSLRSNQFFQSQQPAISH